MGEKNNPSRVQKSCLSARSLNFFLSLKEKEARKKKRKSRNMDKMIDTVLYNRSRVGYLWQVGILPYIDAFLLPINIIVLFKSLRN